MTPLRWISCLAVVLSFAVGPARPAYAQEPATLLEQARLAYAALPDGLNSPRADLLLIRGLLDQLVNEYPASVQAVDVLTGNVAGMDIAALDDALARPDPPAPIDVATPLIAEPVPTPIAPPEAPPEPVAPPETPPEPEWTRAEWREAQGRLASLDHDPGGVDGIAGPGTRAALAKWQAAAGYAERSPLSAAQMARLRDDSAQSYARWQERQKASKPAQAAPRRSQAAKSKTNPTGRYMDRRGCLREPNGGYVTNFRADCR
ncbi:MAG: peptidoglycan-binding protein [Paracoccus sp. (in: a-proteobacteria)]|nr:peptidoglycan-binding protein [Paracoccus sp. (in: a-proteobacteria)]